MYKIFLLIIPFFLFGCGSSDFKNTEKKKILDIQLKEHKIQKNISKNIQKSPDNIDKSLESLAKEKNTPEEFTKQQEIDFEALLEGTELTDEVIEYGQKNDDLAFQKPQTGMKILATVDGLDFNLEVAQTEEEREKGLMFRKSLDPDGGMIFIFEKPDQYAFWMKNTLIPLDIIWLDEHKKIIDFIIAEPCEKDPCRQLSHAGLAKYVVEIPAGNFTGEIGDFVSF